MSNNNKLFWFENVESRPHPWPGLNWLTALITVPDVQKARDLYIAAFDFVSIYDKPGKDGSLMTCRLRWRGSNILLVKQDTFIPGQSPSQTNTISPVTFYIYVDDVSTSYNQALNAGMKSYFCTERYALGR